MVTGGRLHRANCVKALLSYQGCVPQMPIGQNPGSTCAGQSDALSMSCGDCLPWSQPHLCALQGSMHSQQRHTYPCCRAGRVAKVAQGRKGWEHVDSRQAHALLHTLQHRKSACVSNRDIAGASKSVRSAILVKVSSLWRSFL